MSVQRILPIEHPSLQRVCSRVNRVSPSIRKLMLDLEDTMASANGVGLAAPQIGKPLRVITVLNGDDVLTLANPEIVKGSGKSVEEEGCLSLPLYYGPVARVARITVRGLDPRGNKVRRKAEGLLARALQHEIDHLNGVIFKDKLARGGKLRFVGQRTVEADEQGTG